MTNFYSLYSSEIYSIAIRLSYDRHLETQKNICHCKALSNRLASPVSEWAGSFRVTLVVTTAAWALGTVKSTDVWHFPFVSLSYTSVPLPFKVHKVPPFPGEWFSESPHIYLKALYNPKEQQVEKLV